MQLTYTKNDVRHSKRLIIITISYSHDPFCKSGNFRDFLSFPTEILSRSFSLNKIVFVSGHLTSKNYCGVRWLYKKQRFSFHLRREILLCSGKQNLKVGLPGQRLVFATKNLLKMMKNPFYFTVKP